MRGLIGVALLVILLALPGATAAGGGLQLTGPSEIRASVPVSLTLGVILTLEGVVCAKEAEVPIDLRVTEATGVESAKLAYDRILLRLAPGDAATQTWRRESVAALRIAPGAGGQVGIAASYALPTECVATQTPAEGETSMTIRVTIPDGATAPRDEITTDPVPVTRASETPPGSLDEDSRLRSIVLRPTGLPGPVFGAILATAAAAVLVIVKRVRATTP